MESNDQPRPVRIYHLGGSPGRNTAQASAPVAVPVAEKPATGSVAIFTTGGLPGLAPALTPNRNPAPSPPRAARGPDAATGTPLTNPEKTALGILANAAWRHHIETEDPLAEFAGGSKTASETAWRHAEVAKATADHPQGQRQRIAELLRGHYRDVSGHFLKLLGNDSAALQRFLNTGGKRGDAREDREQAIHLLRQACGRWSYPFPAYPLGIARRRIKNPRLTDLLNVPAGKLKQILFQINTNGAAKAKKEKLQKPSSKLQ